LWIEQNDLVFNNERWNVVKIHKVIWDALLDYSRAAWNRCMKLIRKTPRAKKNFSRSLIRAKVGTMLFVLEEVALLGRVTMGPKGLHRLSIWACGGAPPILGVCRFCFSSQ
jgi:hypothetical protein